ncbi:alpha/beta fold hydrolase [Corynebacterium callunae]|uniref:alpha/beta fold hydrolase n=1 Tax=Corynebacterium callunae TaxID=1721 RepID=UPI001FFEE2A7|nr:alpha/beta hydrolase [Corynebacterium callunae]
MHSRHIVFIPENREMPDVFTEVVNEISPELGLKPRIMPWSGSLDDGIRAVESYLDREEIRKVVLVAAGSGAGVALKIAAQQPQRVEKLILDSPLVLLDKKQLKQAKSALKVIPGFLFRKQSKKDVLSQLDKAQEEPTPAFSQVHTPTLIIQGGAAKNAQGTVLAEQLPQVTSQLIDGAGHLTYRTHGSETGWALNNFLKN